jgi:hypothetical protein
VLYARKVFAVKKVFAIMGMRRDDRCDLASHELSDASRAPSAKRLCTMKAETPWIYLILAAGRVRRGAVGAWRGKAVMTTLASVVETAQMTDPTRS